MDSLNLHKDLYEKKKTLPSRFSLDHKHYFKIENDEAPDTIGILPLLKRNLKVKIFIHYFKVHYLLVQMLYIKNIP